MALRPDPWLSEVLGVASFAVDGEPEDAPAPSFLYSKIDAADPQRVERYERAGFSVVDVNVTLTHSDGEPPVVDGVDVSPAEPHEADALLDVAGSCFRYSRFHLDPRIPRDAADRVKREWVRNYLEGRRGLELLTARLGGGPVGFLAVLETDGDRVIDLVGVSEEAQGHGVGTALVGAFVHRHRLATQKLRVGTQIANTPSLRLYERCGFVVTSAAYVLHRHLEA